MYAFASKIYINFIDSWLNAYMDNNNLLGIVVQHWTIQGNTDENKGNWQHK